MLEYYLADRDQVVAIEVHHLLHYFVVAVLDVAVLAVLIEQPVDS